MRSIPRLVIVTIMMCVMGWATLAPAAADGPRQWAGHLEGLAQSQVEHDVEAMRGDVLVIRLEQARTDLEQRCLSGNELTVFAWTNSTVGDGDIKGPAAQIDACERHMSYPVTSDGKVTVQVKNDSNFDMSYTLWVSGSSAMAPTPVPASTAVPAPSLPKPPVTGY